MANNKLIPAIRFKGFEDEWEEKKLGEVGGLLTGNPFESKKFVKDGILLIRGMNVKRGFLDVSDDLSEYWPTSKGIEIYLLEENDLVIQMDGALIGKSYAKISKKNLPALLVQRVTRIRSTKANSEFIYQKIKRDFLNHISKTKTETAVPHLSLNDIKDFEIDSPSANEQTQIGNYFKDLDSLIQLQEQKLEKVSNLKKAMLEKMFPKENADVPEIRFRGYAKNWEQEKLGKVVNISSASRVHKNEWVVSGVPFFRSSDVVSAYKGQHNTKAYISYDLYLKLSSISGTVKKDDILITGGGSVGIPYLVKSDDPLYFKDADLLWIKNTDNIDGYFLYTFFLTQFFRNYLGSITHIGTISHYTIEQAKGTPIYIPDYPEQQKIGQYFQNLDQLIVQSQLKIEQLKHLKQALLQKMFI